MIALGFLAAHFGIVDEGARKGLSNLVIDLIYPCYVINSFVNNIGMFDGGDMLFILGISILVQGSLLLCNQFLYRKVPKGEQAILRYGTVVPNSAFLGVPMVESVFGNAGLICGSIFVIPIRINTFGIAIGYFFPQKGVSISARIKQLLLQPTIIATVAGIIFMLTAWRPPELCCNIVSSVGACSTPLCMMTIGMVIQANAKQIHPNKRMVEFTLARLIVIPAIVFVLFRLANFEAVLVGTAVLLAAMPIGTTAALLADKYDMDVAFAGELVLITTVGSLITLPIWSYLCLYV